MFQQPAFAQQANVCAFVEGEPQVFLPDAEQESRFVEQLNRMGLKGLQLILDELLPDTVETPRLHVSPAEMHAWIEQLDGDSFQQREAASRRLTSLGAAAVEPLKAAAKQASPEIAYRAVRILRALDDRKYEDKSAYLTAFSTYCESLNDAPRLNELLRRTCKALQADIRTESRDQVLAQCVAALARPNRPEYNGPLVALMRQRGAQVGAILVQGATRGPAAGEKCSEIVVSAIESNDEQLISYALQWCYFDSSYRGDTRLAAALRRQFAERKGELQFIAAGQLARAFRDRAAVDFLLERVENGDEDQRTTALGWLSCEEREPTPPDSRLLEVITPLLRSKSEPLRYTAACTLASYDGEDVVRRLVPLLGEEDTLGTRDCLTARLAEQKDQSMVRQVLNEQLTPRKPAKLRRAVRALLQQLDEKTSPHDETQSHVEPASSVDPFGDRR